MDSTVNANKKINRAIAASAASIGAKVHIKDEPGAWPRWNDRTMMPVFKDAMNEVLTSVSCKLEKWNAGCSDMGDMASLMPTIQAYVGGACGTEHGSDYYICDPETACIDAAKIQLIALKLLLENDAQKAREAIAFYKPYFKDKSEYFTYINRIEKDCDAVIYKDDGNVLLNIGFRRL